MKPMLEIKMVLFLSFFIFCLQILNFFVDFMEFYLGIVYF